MKIWNVNDEAFKKYGKVMEEFDVTDLIREMEHTPLPGDVVYVPSVQALEALPVAAKFKDQGFGGLPIQIGYCNGNNHKLNALEYHRSSEINVAVSDLVLLLGMEQDIEADGSYPTSKVEAFLVPSGSVIEVYATTLHYAPCNAAGGDGFKCVVILPEGTNTELDFEIPSHGEASMLTAKNKWLIAHQEAGIEGAFNGLKGENIQI